MKKVFVLGSINMDMVISTPYIPQGGETLTGSNFFLNSGGKGANQAVACSKQKVETYLIGCVGADVFGKDLIQTLMDYGVHCRYIQEMEDTSTGVAMIILCDQDNRIILDSGANHRVKEEYIDAALCQAEENDLFVAQLENNIDAIYYGLKRAKERRMITIFNPAPARSLDSAVYQYVDYLIVNESECEILSGIYPNTAEDKRRAYDHFKKLGVRKLIITLGKNGSVCFADGCQIDVAPNAVEAVDTTAAGDTFVGTLAAALIKDKPLMEALGYSSVASALTCMKKGAQQSIPYLHEVEAYIRKSL